MTVTAFGSIEKNCQVTYDLYFLHKLLSFCVYTCISLWIPLKDHLHCCVCFILPFLPSAHCLYHSAEPVRLRSLSSPSLGASFEFSGLSGTLKNFYFFLVETSFFLPWLFLCLTVFIFFHLCLILCLLGTFVSSLLFVYF